MWNGAADGGKSAQHGFFFRVLDRLLLRLPRGIPGVRFVRRFRAEPCEVYMRKNLDRLDGDGIWLVFSHLLRERRAAGERRVGGFDGQMLEAWRAGRLIQGRGYNFRGVCLWHGIGRKVGLG